MRLGVLSSRIFWSIVEYAASTILLPNGCDCALSWNEDSQSGQRKSTAAVFGGAQESSSESQFRQYRFSVPHASVAMRARCALLLYFSRPARGSSSCTRGLDHVPLFR